jgi:hypothetical protein
MKGKSITSLILRELVNNIINLSIPMPSPAVGGKPYFKEFIKSVSIFLLLLQFFI